MKKDLRHIIGNISPLENIDEEHKISGQTMYSLYSKQLQKYIIIQMCPNEIQKACKMQIKKHFLQKSVDTHLVPKCIAFKISEHYTYLVLEQIFGTSLYTFMQHDYYGEETALLHIKLVILGLKKLLRTGTLIRKISTDQIMISETQPMERLYFLNMESAISAHTGKYKSCLETLETHPLDKVYTVEKSLSYTIGNFAYEVLIGGKPYYSQHQKTTQNIFWPEWKQISDSAKGFISDCLRESEYRTDFSQLLNHEVFNEALKVHYRNDMQS
jgi:serine/threonine protein kinase